ncbi:Flp pilus assembly protein CpaB [Virgibacillus sp. DJP39]|uniref:Flp pilus assembly protein CpaB n=1 Tax=Virgibacillus sp. DJP39 TaxID=3409790 RepID=UPI003BB77AAD
MRSKMIFFLAIIMGIITTVLFLNYTKQFETTDVAAPPMIEVVKAKEKLAENQLITKEVLEVVNVPEENIHPQTVTDLANATGKYATANIEKGEIVLAHRVKDQEEESEVVSRKVKEGFRAVSVAVANVQSVTNLIHPEDHVDVIVTNKYVKGKKEGINSELLLSDVRVLAVGKKMIEKPSGELPEGTTAEGYEAVTLELKPEQAIALINASEQDGSRAKVPGNIHFILRPSIIPPDDRD